MESNSSNQTSWQDLFPINPSGGATVRWRVLRKRGEPLVVLPEMGRLAATALNLYPAQTAKARLAKNVLRRALQWRLPLLLERAALTIDPTAAFSVFLRTQAGTKNFPRLAILCGNARTAGRRHILLLFGENGEPAAVVKAGLGGAAQALIERERAFLAAAGAVENLPGLLGEFCDDRCAAFAIPFLEGESPAVSDEILPGKIVGAWVDETRRVPLAETAPWRELEAACAAHPLMARLATLRTCVVHPVLWHGDLAPWNIRLNPHTDRCVVLDWERGQLTGVPGWDWFHYEIQTGILARKLSPGELQTRLESLLASNNFTAYAQRCGIEKQTHPLALAYLLYCAEVLKPSEGREQIRELLQLLNHSWTNA